MTVNAMMFVPPIDSAETRLTPLEKTPNIPTLPAFGPFRDNATVYVPRGGSVIHPRPDHRAANTSMKAGSSPGAGSALPTRLDNRRGGSHQTLCWRKPDSNHWSPLTHGFEVGSCQFIRASGEVAMNETRSTRAPCALVGSRVRISLPPALSQLRTRFSADPPRQRSSFPPAESPVRT